MSQQDSRNQMWVITEEFGEEGGFKGHLVQLPAMNRDRDP